MITTFVLAYISSQLTITITEIYNQIKIKTT